MNAVANHKLLPYIALGAVCFLWGTTYLALRIGVLGFPPLLFTAIRQILAGGILTGILLLFTKVKLPDRQTIITQAIGGFFLISIGNGFIGWAEVNIPSGVAAIICSVMPIWVILINLAVAKDEKPTFPILVGFVIGLSGIVMIFGEHIAEFSNMDYTFGIIVTFAANIGWALGSVWMKKKNHSSNAFMNAGLQMFFGGLYLLPLSALLDNYEGIHWSTEVVYALVYLILFGSIAAYASFSYALKKLPMTLVSLYAYINPIVAVLLGWVVLDEKLNLRIGFAILITIVGVYIVNRGYQLRKLWNAQFSKT